MSECQTLLLFTLQIKAISRLGLVVDFPEQVLVHTCFQSCGCSLEPGAACGTAALGSSVAPRGLYEEKRPTEQRSVCAKLDYARISGPEPGFYFENIRRCHSSISGIFSLLFFLE